MAETFAEEQTWVIFRNSGRGRAEKTRAAIVSFVFLNSNVFVNPDLTPAWEFISHVLYFCKKCFVMWMKILKMNGKMRVTRYCCACASRLLMRLQHCGKNRRTSSQVSTYSIEFEFFRHLLWAFSTQKLCLHLSVIGSDLNPSLGASSVLSTTTCTLVTLWQPIQVCMFSLCLCALSDFLSQSKDMRVRFIDCSNWL